MVMPNSPTMLKADIAVLEGGYSIEGALPYINTGIIMAMAGMDYGHLQEPDYRPEQLRQSREISQHIEKTCDNILELWGKRRELAEAIRKRPDCNQRERQIFYDTDGIMEMQQETIRLCDSCAGALAIDSKTDRGAHIFGVHLPRRACPACREQGMRWYEEADRSDFDQIFLQDRDADNYL